MKKLVPLTFALMSLVFSSSAQASWGPNNECSVKEEPNGHCYGLAERNVARWGGVLASIDFVDTDYNTDPPAYVPSGGFVSNEEWISFPADGDKGWIETGQAMGEPYDSSLRESVEIHPFFAEKIYFGSDYNKGKGTYHEYLSPGTLPAGGAAFEKSEPYNHYVLYDPEQNGLWRIYWGCCEVGSYGGGWPAFLTYQEAGVEAAATSKPLEWGRQEVADSDGGTWTPWEPGEMRYHSPAITIENNEEDSAAGDIEWGL